jgi:hypothetical protein
MVDLDAAFDQQLLDPASRQCNEAVSATSARSGAYMI